MKPRNLQEDQDIHSVTEDEHCTSDKNVIEKLMENYKSFRTPSETGVIVWIEVLFPYLSEETKFFEGLGPGSKLRK